MEELLLLLVALAGGAHGKILTKLLWIVSWVKQQCCVVTDALLWTCSAAFPDIAAVPVTKCDFSSLIFLIPPPCTPALGGTVYIKLMDNATGYVLAFSKNLPGEDVKVFIVKEGKVKIRQEYRNRTEFSIRTGTLQLTDVERNDTGQYTLDVLTPPPKPLYVERLSFTLKIKGKF